jgi:hypothetical protein
MAVSILAAAALCRVACTTRDAAGWAAAVAATAAAGVTGWLAVRRAEGGRRRPPL